MSLTKNELNEIKERLQEEKAKLEIELEKIAKPSSDGEDYKTKYEDMGSHRDENATEVEEYVGNIAVEKNLEERLGAVKDSLAEIKNGTYGKCKECGGEIKKERLEANPSAKRCMKCANK